MSLFAGCRYSEVSQLGGSTVVGMVFLKHCFDYKLDKADKKCI